MSGQRSCAPQMRTVKRRNFEGSGRYAHRGWVIHRYLSAVRLTIICVLADAPFPSMFYRGIHLKPFLRLEYVILRDDTVHTFAQAHAYTGGDQQHAGQRRLVGQGNMDVIRRSSRAT